MGKDIQIINLFRKIICSLLCINKDTKDPALKLKSNEYLEELLEEYKLYINKGTYSLTNYDKVIDFCNDCYEDKDIFDFAEDVEYGLRELIEVAINKGGMKNG